MAGAVDDSTINIVVVIIIIIIIIISLLYKSNSTWLVTSRLDTTRQVRRVEPMHGCVELVEQHGSTRSTRLARLVRHVERVESCRDVT